jgi:hypothetical protein
MVMQLSSTALILMGRAPNPMTGKTETDLDSAQLFIEQLEMLAVKTKGNLGAEEEHLLKQQLMNVRMSFVQTVEAAKKSPTPAQPIATDSPTATAEAGPGSSPGDESKKKFTKSYGAQ